MLNSHLKMSTVLSQMSSYECDHLKKTKTVALVCLQEERKYFCLCCGWVLQRLQGSARNSQCVCELLGEWEAAPLSLYFLLLRDNDAGVRFLLDFINF